MKKDPLSPISPNKNDTANGSNQKMNSNASNSLMKNWLNKAQATKTSASKEPSSSSSKTASATSTAAKTTTPTKASAESTSSKKHIDTSKKSPKIEKSDKVSAKEIKSKAKETIDEDAPKKSKKSTASKKSSTFDNDDDDDFVEEKTAKKSTKKADKAEEKLNTSTGKKQGSKFYAAYMQRGGPKNPGSKKIPIGKKDCFAGIKFLISGVLESMERDECKNIIEKYGGSCISGVTKKLDYLIVGEDAGQSKLEKANELNIKQINEDEFLELICTKSGIKNPKYENDDQEEEALKMEVSDEEEDEIADKKQKKTKLKVLDKSSDLEEENQLKKAKKDEKEPVVVKKEVKSSPTIKKEVKSSPTIEKKQVPNVIKKEEPIKTSQSQDIMMKKEKVDDSNVETELWVEKHKPKSMSKIIGQGTEKSNANKLLNWLKNWNKWHRDSSGKSGAKRFNDQDTGSSFKAALLSGPPGIGKTTTATLVAKEAGYTFIELNASDSRSKKLLDKILGESSDSCSMDAYLHGKHKPQDVADDKHCIIMDEVDGMAGNEDRGGILELINTIKNSKIPFICICNDRQHIKIRSLANYCFDLRFYKPSIQQVRAALMTICFKEKIKVTNDVLDQIIIGCNYDIRQCLNNLSMWSSNNKTLSAETKIQNDIGKAMKDIRMNPFEACKQVFQSEQHTSTATTTTSSSNKPPKTLIDKMDLFFTDYSLMPLLIQENYLNVKPNNLKGHTKQQKEYSHLKLVYESIDSMCNSDMISRMIRTNNNWSLLPSQAIFATVVPGEKLSGQIGLPSFPGWFGKNSKIGRVDRILQELQKHMRIKISANKLGVGMDYLSVLRDMLSKPLIRKGADGIPQVLNIMNEYFLTREDFDTILELSTWPGQPDLMSKIDSKVKASFTRAYNKEAHMNPFSIVNIKKLKAGSKQDDLGEYEDAEGEISDEDDEKKDDIASDAMIKINTKKKPATTKSSSSSSVKRGAEDAAPTKPTSKKKKT